STYILHPHPMGAQQWEKRSFFFSSPPRLHIFLFLFTSFLSSFPSSSIVIQYPVVPCEALQHLHTHSHPLFSHVPLASHCIRVPRLPGNQPHCPSLFLTITILSSIDLIRSTASQTHYD